MRSVTVNNSVVNRVLFLELSGLLCGPLRALRKKTKEFHAKSAKDAKEEKDDLDSQFIPRHRQFFW